VGPRPGEHYFSIRGWQEQPIDLIEVSTADVTRVLCDDAIKTGQQVNLAPPQFGSQEEEIPVRGNDNEAAIAQALARQLRLNEEMLTRDAAAEWCQQEGFKFTARGFRFRIWPEARREAGFPKRAPPGRKKKKF
jgi:hypothetical protein